MPSDSSCFIISLRVMASSFGFLNHNLREELDAVLAPVVEKLLHLREWKGQASSAVPQHCCTSQILPKICDALINFQCPFVVQPVVCLAFRIAQNDFSNVCTAAQHYLVIIVLAF